MTLTEKSSYRRRHIVLAHADAGFAEASGRHYRCHGWEIHEADGGAEARRLARLLSPDVVVLDTHLADESGWLTCAKLTQELPDQRVILVDAAWSSDKAKFAAFVGADALVSRAQGLSQLLDEVIGSARLSKPA